MDFLDLAGSPLPPLLRRGGVGGGGRSALCEDAIIESPVHVGYVEMD
jgi:hypothetical protein